MSASSPVAICNRALTLLGADTIVSFLDESTEAKMCNIHYAQVRDAVTNEMEWSFAIRRFGPLVPEVDAPAYGFTYSYLLPVDLLKLTFVAEDADGRRELREFSVENNRLLCDRGEGVYIQYVGRETDTTKFTQLFTEALVTRLAAELCVPLTESSSHMQRLFQLYQAKLNDAAAVDNQQMRNQPTTAIKARRARWTGGAYAPGFFRAGQ